MHKKIIFNEKERNFCFEKEIYLTEILRKIFVVVN